MIIFKEKLLGYDVLVKLAVENDWRFGAELGVKAGQSIEPVLKACPELFIFAVDVWDEFEGIKPKYLRSSTTWNHDSNYGDYLIRIVNNPHYTHRVRTLKMKTSEAHAYVYNKSLDYVFVDGDSRKEGSMEDIENWLPKIKLGGYIVGHDYYLEGPDKGVREAVTHFFGNDITLYTYDKTWFKRL